ncbi:hypothetical protein MCG45_06815 [Clostridium perfringens]|uniref:hypothetical protein n=1 Tax=Clostridium perfringens TaxID=1502 RepID=UPI001F0595C9|nr:hypothetical protein [Clostridium perfringens]MCH1962587.1 hypothetical protein [Clostridium perfringens]
MKKVLLINEELRTRIERAEGFLKNQIDYISKEGLSDRKTYVLGETMNMIETIRELSKLANEEGKVISSVEPQEVEEKFEGKYIPKIGFGVEEPKKEPKKRGRKKKVTKKVEEVFDYVGTGEGNTSIFDEIPELFDSEYKHKRYEPKRDENGNIDYVGYTDIAEEDMPF